MKKFLAMLLVMVMIFSLGVIATEVVDDNQVNEDETVQISEESLEPIIENTTEDISEEEDEQIYFKSKVIEASEPGEKEYIRNYYGEEIAIPVIGQDLKLLVLDGKYKGVEINLVYPLGEQGATEYGKPAKVGQKIYITVAENFAEDGNKTYRGEIVLGISPVREIFLIVSIIVLLVLIVLLSRLKSIRIISIILLNILILVVAVAVLYFKPISSILVFVTATILIIISNIFIINNYSRKSLVAVLGVMLATIMVTGLSIAIMNILEVKDAFSIRDYYGNIEKEYHDLGVAIMVIASVGVAINMAIKTVNEYVKGDGVLATIKVVSADLVKCLNGVLLVAGGVLLTNIFYIVYQKYPLYMILLGDNNVFIEFVKILIIALNPIIVIPITAVFSKFLLQPTKSIDIAK